VRATGYGHPHKYADQYSHTNHDANTNQHFYADTYAHGHTNTHTNSHPDW